jgi:trehalose/maltose transport system permease protein
MQNGQTLTGAGPLSRLNSRQRLFLELCSGLLILIGAVAILWFLNGVANDPGINEVNNWVAGEADEQRPSLVLAFLDSFGIILPVLILTLSALLILLGIRLRRLNINTVQWAKIVYLWMALAVAAVALLNLVTNEFTGAAFATALPIGLLAVPMLAARHWLEVADPAIFVGQETLSARQARTAWNLLMPTMIVIIVVAARPLEQTFINSLTDKRFATSRVPQYVGLSNYTQLLTIRFDEVECRRDEDTDVCQQSADGSTRWQSVDRALLESGYRTVWNLQLPLIHRADTSTAVSGLDRDWLRSMLTTLQFAVGSVFFELLIGLFIALVVNSGFRGRGFMRAVMLVPWAIPTVISARLWELILKDTSAGIINRVLLDVGLLNRPEAWLVQSHLQVPSAIMVDVWKTSPFMALLLLAGLQTIPTDLYEAAAVDGANRIRQFFSITLPLLRPTIAVALVFRTLDALRVFDLFNVLFGRQQLTMATYNYETLVNNQADGYASAVGVLIFIFIFIFAVIYVRLLGVETE